MEPDYTNFRNKNYYIKLKNNNAPSHMHIKLKNESSWFLNWIGADMYIYLNYVF
jgi:hypothetical protein